MRSVLYVAALGLVCFVAIWAYQVINDTRMLLEDVERLHGRIARERESISVLRAEWAWLNRPERLERLAALNGDALALAPMTPDDFGTATSVAFQPPPPHAPGPVPNAPMAPNALVFAQAGGLQRDAETAVDMRGPAAPAQAPDADALAADKDGDLAPAGPMDPLATSPSTAPAFGAPPEAPELDADGGALIAGLERPAGDIGQGIGGGLADTIPAQTSEPEVQLASLEAGLASTPASTPAAMSEADMIQSLVMQAQGWMPPPRPAGR